MSEPTTGCVECDENIAVEYRFLEANVDAKYRGAPEYQVAKRNGVARCSLHGMTLTGPMALVGKKNPVLRAVSAPVLLDELEHPRRLKELTDRMLATCRVKGGIAIAAPQVGVSQRIIVTWDGKIIINPELEFEDSVGNTEWSEEVEGCLSIPGRAYAITRPVSVGLSWIDLDGADGWAMTEGLDARMFQHEVDHLDGILISERGREVPNVNHGAMKF